MKNPISFNLAHAFLLATLMNGLVQNRAHSEQLPIALVSGPEPQISRLCQTFRCENVFSQEERRLFKELSPSLSHSPLTASVSVFGSPELLERSLKTFSQLSFEWRVPIQLQELPGSTPSQPESMASEAIRWLQTQNWGIHNRGIPQRLAIDDLNSEWIPGTIGEDIGLTRSSPYKPSLHSRPVRVAILDTGIDLSHPALSSAIAQSPLECEELQKYQACLSAATDENSKLSCDQHHATLDRDSNGYPLDCSGWNVTAPRNRFTGITGSPIVIDDKGHGTHVAGIVRQAFPEVELIPVSVIQTSPNPPIRPQGLPTEVSEDSPPLPSPVETRLRWPSSFTDMIARGFLYALHAKADIIHLSLAWPTAVNSPILQQVIELAQSRGVLVVAAAGNDASDSRVLPCAISGVICVGSHNPDGSRSHFSNYGSFVDIYAPGLQILSAWPLSKSSVSYTGRSGVDIKNGTSMAAPFVTGALARVMAEISSIKNSSFGTERLRLARAQQARETILSSTRVGDARQSFISKLDLAQALGRTPRARMILTKKEVLSLPISSHPTHVSLSLQLLGPDLKSVQLRFFNSDWGWSHFERVPIWQQGRPITFSIPLPPESSETAGKSEIQISMSTDAAPQEMATVTQPIEFYRLIDRSLPSEDSKIFQLAGTTWNSETDVFQVLDVTEPASRQSEILLGLIRVEKSSTPDSGEYPLSLTAQIVDRNAISRTYRVIRTLSIPVTPQHEFLKLVKVGAESYEFFFKVPPVPGQKQYAIERIRQTATIERFTYDNLPSVFPENAQWLRIDGEWSPAWISFGKLPQSKLPPSDPWDEYEGIGPKESAIESRFYVWTRQGVSTLSPQKGTFWVSFLNPTDNQTRLGTRTTLIAKGSDFVLDYFWTLSPSTLRSPPINLNPLSLPRYRMLLGIDSQQTKAFLQSSLNSPGHSLSSNQSVTAFTSSTKRGGQRLTVLTQTFSDEFSESSPISFKASFKFKDAQFHPWGQTEDRSIPDSIMRVGAVFYDDAQDRLTTFTQSHYWMEAHDSTLPTRARTSLDRFSFLPSLIFNRSMEGILSNASTPLLVVPRFLGMSAVTEYWFPDFQNGHWSRPAKMRLKVPEGCDELPRPIIQLQTPELSVAHHVTLCTDKVIETKLH